MSCLCDSSSEASTPRFFASLLAGKPIALVTLLRTSGFVVSNALPMLSQPCKSLNSQPGNSSISNQACISESISSISPSQSWSKNSKATRNRAGNASASSSGTQAYKLSNLDSTRSANILSNTCRNWSWSVPASYTWRFH